MTETRGTGWEGGELPERVQRLVEMGRVRAHASTPDEVVILWRKALESASDAALAGMSLDGALRAAYDGGHLAVLALLACHGLRPSGGQGHHEAAFACAAALGYPGLEELVPDSMEIRALRKGSMYDPSLADPSDRAHALAWVARTLPALRGAILVASPSLAPRLPNFRQEGGDPDL
jgi:hypothetical protein